MDTILNKDEEKKGINRGLIIGIFIAVIAIGAMIFYLSTKPSRDQQVEQILAGSYHEGSPEFEEITKDIIISTDDKTVESPTAFGTISMYINGKIRNKGTKTINGLEVNVAV